jgi:hypothetical protein
VDWREVYKKLHKTNENSELRALGYKIVFAALPCHPQERLEDLDFADALADTAWKVGYKRR